MKPTRMPLEPAERAGFRALFLLIVAYVGVYLCRKNLSVAIPLLQPAFGVSKAELGILSTVGTAAYAAGKFINGAVVDRLGGRRGLLLSLVLVALFGAVGAFAPGLSALAFVYGLNRFAGSASWGAMLKLVPTWFRPVRTGTAVGVLSLSYLSGGVLATYLAAQVVRSGGGWRAVMGVPSIFLAAILALVFFTVRAGPLGAEPAAEGAPVAERRALGPVLIALLGQRGFLVTCALSFTLTLMRETFNTWGVDFLLSIQHGEPSLVTAALQSSAFDLAGFPSILAAGIAYDRVRPERRSWLMAGSLALLAMVLAALPGVAASSTAGAAVLVGAVGLLVYGPYSLLAGALAVENGGKEAAATAAGVIDGVGYVAGALAGSALGKLLDVGGYALGFRVLAVMTMASAAMALALPAKARS
jgi:sugar phosphate permease